MPKTYEPIASTTLSGSSSTITLSSIPATYTDLILLITVRTDRAGQATDGLNIKLNNDDSNIYSDTQMIGNGSSASSTRNVNTSRWLTNDSNLPAATATSGVFSNIIVHLLNYSNTTTFKTGLCRFDLASSNTGISAGLYRSTSAINSIILISRNNANFVTGSTFTLYGVKAA